MKLVLLLKRAFFHLSYYKLYPPLLLFFLFSPPPPLFSFPFPSLFLPPARSVEVARAARLVYDDIRRAAPPGGEARALDMLAAHHMLAYAHNLETLAATLTGLTVWATPGETGYTAA